MKNIKDKVIQIFSDNSKKMKKNDFIIVGILMFLYAIISFINLGSFKNPQTFVYLDESKSASFSINETTEVYKIRFYSGEQEGSFIILGSEDGVNYDEIATIKSEYCFEWYDQELNKNIKYFTIVGSEGGYLGEIQLYDIYGEKIEINAESEVAELLIDEPKAVPKVISYMNSTYFDEIYFARTAYDYTHDIIAMEWVHPPLGKLIQAIPVAILGMTPFAYRLMGNIAGILMIYVTYVFAKEIFKNRKYAFLAACFMAFDNFHFAQTRMGTVDSHLVLFCMISALYMYRYLTLPINATLKSKTKNLMMCGVFFGLATCVKWTGLYCGLGLAIMFFAKMIYDVLKDSKIAKQYSKIILNCILYFIIIPCIMYVLCYLLFPNVAPYGVHNIKAILQQINWIYDYHSTLDATHPFTSKWYTWPLMLKPVWLYYSNPSVGLKATISGIGNPIVWWGGAIGMVYTFVSSIAKKNKNNLFITIMYLSMWMPYIFIGRVMFLYHYFPALPFAILGLTSFVKWLTEKFKKNWIPVVFLVLVIIMFIWFYPISSGMTVPESYIESMKWLDTWWF